MRSTAVAFCAPNKNKTTPRENLEFVLFFTRDYFGLKRDLARKVSYLKKQKLFITPLTNGTNVDL